MADPAQKLLAAVLLVLGAALKPFWAKFSEGLADLAIELLRYKLKRDHPELFKDEKERDRPALPKATKEVAPKHGNRDQKASGPHQPKRRRKPRGHHRR